MPQESAVKTASLLLVPACLALLVWSPDALSIGLYRHAVWWHRLSYMFFHANIIHLAMNMWALLTLIFFCRIDIRACLLAFLSAALIPDAFLSATPVVGLSGAIYFLVGYVWPQLRYPRKFIITNLVCVLLTGLLINIAWQVHFWCFTLGVLTSIPHGRH